MIIVWIKTYEGCIVKPSLVYYNWIFSLPTSAHRVNRETWWIRNLEARDQLNDSGQFSGCASLRKSDWDKNFLQYELILLSLESGIIQLWAETTFVFHWRNIVSTHYMLGSVVDSLLNVSNSFISQNRGVMYLLPPFYRWGKDTEKV